MFNLRDPVFLTVQDQKGLLFSPAQLFIDKAICLTLQHGYVLWLMMKQSSSSLIKKNTQRKAPQKRFWNTVELRYNFTKGSEYFVSL